MKAVIEKELKSYFFTIRGYVFIGVFLLITGIYFVAYNLIGGNSDVGVMLENTIVAFVLLIPVLTMGLFAGEKKNGTEKLFFASPLAKWEIILGKYIAAVFVFVAAAVLNSISALIMVFYKGQTFGEIFALYTGYVLIGMAFISVGMFISALTDNQIVAAILSFCACFLLYLSDWLLSISSNPVVSMFAMTAYYSNFLVGVFDIKAVLYFVSFIGMFLLLTILYIEKVEIKTESKFGFWTIMICIIVSFLAFNYCVDKISAKVQMTFDMSQNKIFEISNETEDYLETVTEDVMIYYLTEAGQDNPYVSEIVGRYIRENSHIKSKNIDMIKNPSFTAKYVSEGETIDKGALIIESDKRFTFVDPGSIFIINRGENGEISRELGFTLETKITQAIDYVLQEKEHTALFLTGHGEQNTNVPASMLKGENIQVAYAKTLSNYEGTPDVLIIYAPLNDISGEEMEEIRGYLDTGGKLMLILNPGLELGNMKTLAAEYGMEMNDDILAVDDMTEIIQNNRLYLMAYPTDYEANEGIAGIRNLLFPVGASINLTNVDHVTVSPLALTVPKTASRVLNADSMGEKLATGTFTVVAKGENTVNGSAVLLSSSSQFIDSPDGNLGDILNAYNYCNKEFLIKNIKSLMEYEDSILITPKSIMSRSLNLSSGMQSVLALIFGILLPLAVFLMGFVIFKRRRNR